MRIFNLLFALFCALHLHAQSVPPVREWCAASKRHTAQFPSVRHVAQSDSFDIIRTDIRINITDFAQQTIESEALIEFVSLHDQPQIIHFDLLTPLTVSSVIWGAGSATTWSFDGQKLTVHLPSGVAAGDTLSLTVRYGGHPSQDASGWGGFYWQGDYAYNLGVGFAADPHNYGRAWFPCFDNFTERSAMRFEVTCPAHLSAYCNGTLQLDTLTPDNRRLRIFNIDEPIPSYLACVAVGPYLTWRREFSGEEAMIPVEVAVAAADTNALNLAFQHLGQAVEAFEYWYGPYRWPKVGYSVVPFSSGAMEHATNIAYMRPALFSWQDFETLMAHELSHHWWGDLATCSTAEDMWLNEGWATYSEHLFLENVYGRDRYDAEVESNFLAVIQNTHINEVGYRAVSGIPHEITYGEHVYNKGAIVAHNLRGYLGDSLFRIGLRAVMEQTQFEDFSSAELRDKLSDATGYDLTNFFEDWVFQPGFIDFAVDSTWIEWSPVDANKFHFRIRQTLRGADHFAEEIPLKLSVHTPGGTFLNPMNIVMSGEKKWFTYGFSFGLYPGKIRINPDDLILQARATKEIAVASTGNLPLNPAKLSLNVLQVPSPVSIRAEHHFAMPDTTAYNNPDGFVFSNRYWLIDGAWTTDQLDAVALFTYDGRGYTDQLDHELFEWTGYAEDSVILAYRPNPNSPWREYPDYVKTTLGSTTDRFGQLRANHVAPGEYAVAKGASTVGLKPELARLPVSISPNPAIDHATIENAADFEVVTILNESGEQMAVMRPDGSEQIRVPLNGLPSGVYWVLVEKAGAVGGSKIVKQ